MVREVAHAAEAGDEPVHFLEEPGDLAKFRPEGGGEGFVPGDGGGGIGGDFF